MNIGATRGLANGVEIQAAQVAPQVGDGLEVGLRFTKPLRQARPGSGFNLDERRLVVHKPLFSHAGGGV